LVEQYNYDVFGYPNAVSSVGNRFMFTGREYDNEAVMGLYYYRARYYKPSLGRFLQPDPVGYYDSMNLYQYCLNNPVKWRDPFGLYKWDTGDFLGATGGGALGGAAAGCFFPELGGPGVGAAAGAIGCGLGYIGGWAISETWHWLFPPDKPPDDPPNDPPDDGGDCSGGAGAGAGAGAEGGGSDGGGKDSW
jgi:RHS repeat-associated protein